MATSWNKVERLAWSGHDLHAGFGAGVPLDPYFVWAEVTDFADLGGALGDEEWIPVAIEVGTGKTAQTFAQQTLKAEWKDWIWVSAVYLQPPDFLRDTRYCTARVRRRFFEEVGNSLKEWVDRFELALPSLSVKEPFRKPWNPPDAGALDPIASRGAGKAQVVVGIIDDALAFAHGRFREPSGTTTRVDSFWNQDDPEAGYGQQYTQPSRLGYGRELTKASIDRLIEGTTRHGTCDEDSLYRLAGNRQVARAFGHGTAVMDIACGRAPSSAEIAPRIVCVQLSRSTRADASRRSRAVSVLDALRFILDAAYRRAGSAFRLAINFSYAPFAGPHDGTSILEAAMDELIKLSNKDGPDTSKLAIVLPAGNGYLERCHAKLSITADEPRSLLWKTLPDDATPSFLEIWVPTAAAAALSVRVTSPNGDESGWIGAGTVYQWQPCGEAVCVVAYTSAPVAPDGRHLNLLLLAVAPTVASRPGQAAPSGHWKIEFANSGRTTAEIDAWIQRDDSPLGDLPLGRQSRFEDPAYERYDHAGRLVQEDNESYIKREGTLSGMASGERTIVIGGYNEASGAVASYSGSGPIQTRHGPDATAVSERSAVRQGLPAAGTRSGSTMALNGTSVAAPEITKRIARRLAEDATWIPSPQSIEQLAMQDDPDPPAGAPAQPPGGYKPKPPRARIGGGRVQLKEQATGRLPYSVQVAGT